MYAKRYIDVKKAQEKAQKEKLKKSSGYVPKYKSNYNGKMRRS